MTRRRRDHKRQRAMAAVEHEYGMPAIDVIRWEAYTGNYSIRRVASDLGMSEFMLHGLLKEHGIEWNRQSPAESVGTMPEYTLHVVGE